MADAINTGNPVPLTKFVVNDYEMIRGGRVNQQTARGRLAFLDTNGRYTLPRTITEAAKAAFVLDWPKPLNPPPYFDGAGLNGAPPYGMNDGSLGAQETDFSLDPDQNYQAPWPIGYTVYDIPPMFLDLPVASGNKALVFDGGTFTFGSGAYVGTYNDYQIGTAVYPCYLDNGSDAGKLTTVASGALVGRVIDRGVFGDNTITVAMKGLAAF